MFEECKGKYKVYVHVNKINGKIYIGQTCNSLSVRAGRKSGIGYKHCTHFYNAIQKYGWENFEHIVLIDGLSLEMANIIEEELIKKYNSMDRNVGYNMMSGGKNKIGNFPSVNGVISYSRRVVHFCIFQLYEPLSFTFF